MKNYVYQVYYSYYKDNFIGNEGIKLLSENFKILSKLVYIDIHGKYFNIK